MNIYGPIKDDPSLFDTLENTLLTNDDKSYIISGELNSQWKFGQEKWKNRYAQKCREKINTLMNSCNVTDVRRIQQPKKNNTHGIQRKNHLYTIA